MVSEKKSGLNICYSIDLHQIKKLFESINLNNTRSHLNNNQFICLLSLHFPELSQLFQKIKKMKSCFEEVRNFIDAGIDSPKIIHNKTKIPIRTINRYKRKIKYEEEAEKKKIEVEKQFLILI